jgi:hypothetical protein
LCSDGVVRGGSSPGLRLPQRRGLNRRLFVPFVELGFYSGLNPRAVLTSDDPSPLPTSRIERQHMLGARRPVAHAPAALVVVRSNREIRFDRTSESEWYGWCWIAARCPTAFRGSSNPRYTPVHATIFLSRENWPGQGQKK